MSKPKRTPIENQLQAYLKWSRNIRQVTDSTYRNKKTILTRFIKSIGVDDMKELTNKKIDWWIAKKISGKTNTGKPYNINSVRTEIATIVAWIGWLRDMDYKLKIKSRMIIIPKAIPSRRKWYSADDIALVLSHCTNLLDEIMIRVLFDTGLRAKEFANLRLENLDGRKIYIIGKGRKQGWVYISDYTAERLNLWIETVDAKDYLWIKGTRRAYYSPMTVDGIRKRIKQLFKEAGFNNFQMHELRHSFATDLRRRGADMDIIQKLMRHSSLQVTQRYLHNLDGDLCSEWDKLKNYKISVEARPGVVYIRGNEVPV